MTYNLLTYTGGPRAGDIVNVNLSDSNGNIKSVSYTVIVGNSIEVIVNALVALIDDSNFTSVIYNVTSFYVKSPNNYTVTANSNIIISEAKQIGSYMWSFNESRKGYCCFYDGIPEWFICAQDTTFMWLNGQIYITNNEEEWGNFFGVQTYPSITLVFNDKESLKKVFNAIAYQSNQIWESRDNGEIKTSMVNPQTDLQQISSLIAQDYEITDNVRYAGLLRDANSLEDARLALLEGDWLNGNWMEITFTYYGSNFVFLYGVYLNYQINQRNF